MRIVKLVTGIDLNNVHVAEGHWSHSQALVGRRERKKRKKIHVGFTQRRVKPYDKGSFMEYDFTQLWPAMPLTSDQEKLVQGY